ncbi:MAG: pyridoxamine 5'-phosphate oxidase family protein [Simkania sp.]|nr:pyridoxamine 5'-phosphate oxidase family protein [Simkania sp.]
MGRDFDPQIVLDQPLMIHLASSSNEGPRSSPLWFLYEEERVWLFGLTGDSFVQRLKKEPRCALSVVDFGLDMGKLLHVGVRGKAILYQVCPKRLERFVGKYLGKDKAMWNEWFVKQVVRPLDVMIEVQIDSIVAKNVSFFKTGPNLSDG